MILLALGVFAAATLALGWITVELRSRLDHSERACERDREAWRAHERELHDRIMFLTGKPWGPPPLEPTVTRGPEPEPVFADFGPEELSG